MKNLDMFDTETEVREAHISPYQINRIRIRYRKASPTEPKCKDCEHCRVKNFHEKRYYKCAIIGLSNSDATDIRANHTCTKWEREEK